MLPIKSGRLKKPVKAVLYGLEGTGKSTLAAQTPNPLFLDTEGGTTLKSAASTHRAWRTWARPVC